MDVPPVLSPPPTVPRPANVPPPKRAFVLTAWLIIMLLFDLLKIISVILAPVISKAVNSLPNSGSALGSMMPKNAAPDPGWFVIITIAVSILDIAAVAGVLSWKRWGYFAAVTASGTLFVINLINGAGLMNSLCYLISPALLYGALKAGGENCGWRRLQ